MKTTINKDPLGLKDKNYSVKEFASMIRSKFGVNDSLPDSILVNVFIEKYPMYSCKIKEDLNKGNCSCC